MKHSNLLFRTTLITVLSFIPAATFADSGEDLFSMSLEEVLDMDVSVTTKGAPVSLREAPGAVTVLDSKFISNSGARDLGELIEMVPGFQFGTDVQGSKTLSFRGIHSRVLLRVDGQEKNELAYQQTLIKNHYPIGIIERVEIIRGPGSVLYGGAAEVAVIEVTTKRPTEGSQGGLVLNGGLTSEGYSRQVGTLWQGIGKDDRYLSVAMTGGQARDGTGDYSDIAGSTFPVKENQDHYFPSVNIGGQYDDISFRYLIDRFRFRQQDQGVLISPEPVVQSYYQDRAELKYAPQLSDEVSAVIQFNYSYDKPWNVTDNLIKDLASVAPEFYAATYFDRRYERKQGTLEFTYRPSDMYSVLVGMNRFNDEGRGTSITGEALPNFDAHAVAAYTELTVATEIASIVAGTRYEDNNRFGDALVSRLALTKAEREWHSKAQVAQSFRAPPNETFLFTSPEDNSLEPERMTLTELEGGYRLDENLYFTTVLFSAKTTDTISISDQGFYDNLGRLETRGVEMNLQYNADFGNAAVGYAFHRGETNVAPVTIIDPMGANLDSSRYLGVSPHSLFANVNYHMSDHLNLNTSLEVQGGKYAYTSVDENLVPIPERLEPVYIWRAVLTARRLLIDNFDLQLGVHNILDDTVEYGHPEFPYHAPMPGMGREF
ncbi:MAG: TonB-dependent receptor, partial [Bdellovibrionales bacterium]|nr:TonB-dependent receptor [Bdellovibrionales bacterium]